MKNQPTTSTQESGGPLTVQHIFTLEDAVAAGHPLFLSAVSAGFPSPADDFIEQKLDLNDHLVRNPAATFFVRVSGDSMTGASIHSGDILVVDRSLEPKEGKVVIAVLDGELTVKRIARRGGRLQLMPENDRYQPIIVANEADLEIWGVVTAVIHAL
jgi:DNA polymerase V